MQEHLNNYREICLKNDVNNYTESCVDLIKSSLEQVDTTNWSSCLKDPQILDEFTNLFTDLKPNEITDRDVKRLFSSIKNDSNSTDKKSPKNVISVSSNDIPPKVLWKNIDISDFFSTNEEDSSSSLFDSNLSAENNAQNQHIPEFYSRNISKPAHFELQQTSKPVLVPDCNISSSSIEKKGKFEFRTGREELIAQNSIKYGNTTNNNTNNLTENNQKPLFAYGAVKKSLGGRRNVQSSFIPPFLQS